MRHGFLLGLGLLLLAPGCDTVALGSPPAGVNACRPSQQFFVERIWPEFLARTYGQRRCSDAGCHDGASPRQLSLPPPSSAPTLPLPADWAAVYTSTAEQVLCTNALASPLLVRPSSPDHGGTKLIEPQGSEAMLVQMWVAAQ